MKCFYGYDMKTMYFGWDALSFCNVENLCHHHNSIKTSSKIIQSQSNIDLLDNKLILKSRYEFHLPIEYGRITYPFHELADVTSSIVSIIHFDMKSTGDAILRCNNIKTISFQFSSIDNMFHWFDGIISLTS